MSVISVVVGSERVSVEAGSTAFDVVGTKDRTIVVATINGELKDLSTVVNEGDVIEGVHISSPEGLAVLRHSTAHVAAQAVQDLYPQSRLGIGPPIKDGFYYDFKTEVPFTPEDMAAIEKRMQEIVKTGQRFVRRVTNEKDALVELAAEPFKVELIGIKGGADSDVMEVGGAELTIYDNVDPRTGETC
ncbi:MAG: hypothetical protein RIS75_1109, partial [Actinomycetota bacterium]